MKLSPFQAIDLEGRMTHISGPLESLTVEDARQKAIEILSENEKMYNYQRKCKKYLLVKEALIL